MIRLACDRCRKDLGEPKEAQADCGSAMKLDLCDACILALRDWVKAGVGRHKK